jgi:hypothetical protein
MQLRAKGFLTNNDFLSDFSGGCYEGISMAVKLEKDLAGSRRLGRRKDKIVNRHGPENFFGHGRLPFAADLERQ